MLRPHALHLEQQLPLSSMIEQVVLVAARPCSADGSVWRRQLHLIADPAHPNRAALAAGKRLSQLNRTRLPLPPPALSERSSTWLPLPPPGSHAPTELDTTSMSGAATTAAAARAPDPLAPNFVGTIKSNAHRVHWAKASQAPCREMCICLVVTGWAQKVVLGQLQTQPDAHGHQSCQGIGCRDTLSSQPHLGRDVHLKQ